MANLEQYEFNATVPVPAPGLELEIPLIAYYYYTPECSGSFADGLQNEPDVDAAVEVVSVIAAGGLSGITALGLDTAAAMNLAGDFSQLEDEILQGARDDY